MYYFNFNTNYKAAMPRILAEDAGAAELRNPLLRVKTESTLPRAGWLKRRSAADSIRK